MPAKTVRKYVVLHSVTIYDLDALFNLNVHGNLAGLPLLDSTGTPHSFESLKTQLVIGKFSASRSHHGLGPNEINPIWGLRRNSAPPSGVAPFIAEHLQKDFGSAMTNSLEVANAEWMWLNFGRGKYDFPSSDSLVDVFGGRFGDKQLLYNSLTLAVPSPPTRLRLPDLPRPGRAGNVYVTPSAGTPSFGGRAGLDDNQNALEGEALVDGTEIMRRPFGHPVSWSGKGRRTRLDVPEFDPGTQGFTYATSADMFTGDNALLPIFLRDAASQGADQWPGYFQYGASSVMSGTLPGRYTFGVDETYSGTNSALSAGGTDDLNQSPAFDENFEDPLEVIFDQDLADRTRDGLAAIGDLLALQWANDATADIKVTASEDKISQHLEDLAPFALDKGFENRQMFTTLSNSLRYIAMREPFGSDGRPGIARFDDDNDGTIDEFDEILTGADPTETLNRSWEYTADSDGADQNNDGLPDGDGLLEFPP
ncbi:MAG: hypothetical protein R3C49_24660, partial [Planctomycetaceae bacterium]